MDYDGHVFQVAATLTPLKHVGGKQPLSQTSTGQVQSTPAPVNLARFL